jgi:tetratricopeptide (TPR) repeat protein
LKVFIKAAALILLLIAITGCSRKKNTFLNRNWHAVTAEYNTLYNGNLALDLGVEALNQNYFDNYWSILPVERMQVREEVMAPGENINPNFLVAEEKAVKAIQRHSMLIEGSEKNPQIDEAYLLLGKARYFDQRFVPALEAFNYILHKYPLSNTINEARIWREKTNMRLEFDEVAIRNLKKILKAERLEKANRAEASAMLAQAYLNIGAQDSAVTHIKNAARFTDIDDKKGRYWYITGQLYDVLGKPDSATFAFEKVVDLNRKIPRVYLVNALIRQIEYQNATSGSKAEVLEQLIGLAEDRENRPYLDKIYFQLAEFYYQQDSTQLAVEYYNKSLKIPSSNSYLQSLDYETLGNINFDAAQYEIAGAYYDSTLLKLPQTSREFRIWRGLPIVYCFSLRFQKKSNWNILPITRTNFGRRQRVRLRSLRNRPLLKTSSRINAPLCPVFLTRGLRFTSIIQPRLLMENKNFLEIGETGSWQMAGGHVEPEAKVQLWMKLQLLKL